jgi:SOS-response transcriptional repressor LexA
MPVNLVVVSTLVKGIRLTTLDYMKKKAGETVDPISVRLDADQLIELDRLAASRRTSRAAIFRELIDKALGLRSTGGVRLTLAEGGNRYGATADEAREPHTTDFPIVALVAAGRDRGIEFTPTGETVSVPNTLARSAQQKSWLFVRVVGDSMEPTFLDGDIVAVEPATREKVKNRDVVYVRLNGDPQIKEIHVDRGWKRVVLLPRNTRHHDPIPVLPDDDSLELLGIVRDLAHRKDASKKG